MTDRRRGLGMSFSVRAKSVRFDEDIWVELSDARTLGVPFDLVSASPESDARAA
jgi:hypothetical protein